MRHSPSTAVLLAVALYGPVGAAQTPASTWTIPGTVNAGGLNNTRFVSDLAVTNPGSVPVQATISFIPANGTTLKQVTLDPGQTVVYRNVLDSLWGAQGAGATQLASDSPLLIRARTYNSAASGTYGVALPVFADDRLLDLGDTADSLWISQSADGSSGYRTNVAVVFPDEGGGSATVTIFDVDGVQIGSKDYSLDGPGFQQFGVGSFAGSVPVGRAEVIVTRGRAAGYSVVVDNVTGDSSLFTFEDLPAGFQDVLVNGVARANGRNNTFFRTDGRFYNPGSTDATVSVAFHNNQSTNPTPLTRTFTVPAGKIRDVVDVLDSLLGLPVGSAGALRFKSDAPVAILCRTSNVDPLGLNPGSFGAQQRPRSLLSFLMSADAGAVVTGIRQNTTFRTNIGFAAGGDGAAYSLILKSTSGATVATATGSLGSFGWTQPNVADLFPGTTVPEDATLFIRVTSGSVDVFDSSIDNASGDPVVTPIMPLTGGVPSSATIGPAGGSIRSSDGVLTLRIPAGALGAPVSIAIDPAPNDAPGGIGSGYDISPGGLAFAKPALLSARYGPGGLDVPEIGSVALAFPVGASWAGLTGGRIDTSARTLSIELSNTSPTPPPSLLAGRTTDAKTIPMRYDFVPAFSITCPQTWVPTDGSTFLVPSFVLPPTGSGEEREQYRVSDLTLHPENVQFFAPKIGAIGRKDANTFTYTAPHGIGHASLPVKVRMRVINVVGAPFTTYEATKILHVVRRKWNLSVQFGLDLQCTGSNKDFAYTYSDTQSQDFVLDDNLEFSPHEIVNVLTQPKVTNCKCSASIVGNAGTISFKSVVGSLVIPPPVRFRMEGQADIENMIPPILTHCPDGIGGTVTDLSAGVPYSFDLFLGLLSVGGLRPSEGVPKFILLEPPLLTIVIEWRSVAE